MLVGNRYCVSTRAASMVPAMPLALSLAPGASVSPSSVFEARESMSPDIITYLSGWVVPRWIAMTFTTFTAIPPLTLSTRCR